MVKLGCYFPAEKPVYFVVRIDLEDDRVTELTKAIYMELKELGGQVTRQDLCLFKTDIPLEPEEDLQSRALKWLHQQPANSQLKVTQRLITVFPDGPHDPSDDKIDIIVADPEVLELIEGLGDPYDVYNRKVKKDLDERLNCLLRIASPSDIAKNPNLQIGVLSGAKPLIYLGRSGVAPPAIFNPALAALQQHLNDLEQVQISRAEVERAAKYLQCTVKFYDTEAHRQNATKELVDQAIGENGGWVLTLSWAADIKPDGSWWYDSFLILVLELKNTLGVSGDALLQAVIDYSKIISQDRYKRFREFCNFPVVLVGITANRLEISVAVCVGPVYTTKLLSLDLSLGFHASDNIIRLARVFGALSRCRIDLKRYYDTVNTLASPKLSCLFPSPTLIDPSKPLPQLTYRQFLSRSGQPTSALVDLGNTATALYIATLDVTNQEVIVKFTARYNEVAHRLLAEAQLAPTLHFCERVVGDLYMVVMDRVDGKSILQLQQEQRPIPRIVLKKLKDAVCLLHENDFVFGDLRDPNIIYAASEDSHNDHVVLIDFDWAGKDGESRYPASLNPSNVWAEEVMPYGIMRKAHDLWQLERLTALCKP